MNTAIAALLQMFREDVEVRLCEAVRKHLGHYPEDGELRGRTEHTIKMGNPGFEKYSIDGVVILIVTTPHVQNGHWVWKIEEPQPVLFASGS